MEFAIAGSRVALAHASVTNRLRSLFVCIVGRREATIIFQQAAVASTVDERMMNECEKDILRKD